MVLDKLYTMAPIIEDFGQTSSLPDPICIRRNVLQALKCIISVQLDCDMLVGHSPYNYSAIGEPTKCTYVHSAHTDYNIPIGDQFYEFKTPITTCVTGDGGYMPRVPYGTPTIPAAFLRVLSLNDCLQHCKHSGILILLSKLSDHHPNIETWMDEICSDFESAGTFAIYSDKRNIWCIFNYIRTDNGDWSWSHKITTRTVGPTAKYNNTALVRWNKGEPKNVQNNQYRQYHALVGNFVKNTDKKSDEQLKKDKFTGYTLISRELANEFALQTECLLEEYKKENPDLDINYKQERELRKKFAYCFKHGYLYVTKSNYNFGLFDPNHMWWSWMKRTLEIFFRWGWCVREWDVKSFIHIAKQLDVTWIITQLTEYVEDINTDRDPKIAINLKTNGEINKNLIHSWPYSLCAAAEVEHKLSQNEDTYDSSGVTLICIVIRASSLMRKGFATLLTDKFELKKDDETPDQIQDMIDNIQLATFIVYHLFDDLVTYILLMYSLYLHLHIIWVFKYNYVYSRVYTSTK